MDHRIWEQKVMNAKYDGSWDFGTAKEDLVHRIHAYPAKFPAFITTKSIDYVHDKGGEIRRVGDIFCGCGTTAYEAKKAGIDFWGCDINPVATLIARVKSEYYVIKTLVETMTQIISVFDEKVEKMKSIDFEAVNERIRYWYEDQQILRLTCLKEAIYEVKSRDTKYRRFFLVAFSNILKATSRWLTKSIKPQVDPHKKPANVKKAFEKQVRYMVRAFDEATGEKEPHIDIEHMNVSTLSDKEVKLDLLVTSPPYVTSYEYADLHQLSTLWLDYVEDYRSLREGTIGSIHNHTIFDEVVKELNKTAEKVVFQLFTKDKKRAKDAARYYLDMQNITEAAYEKITEGGHAFFVIGNTSYKDIRINNAQHLMESMQDAGFRYLKVHKRKISNKILTPYRDKNGRFTKSSSGKKVYSEEFVVIGKKMRA